MADESMDVCLVAVQMKCRPGDVKWNLARAEGLIDRVSSTFLEGKTIICLPELFSTGYNLERDTFVKLAEFVPGPTVNKLVSWANKYGAYIHAGIAEKGRAGVVYDSSILVSSRGLLGSYRKMHLAGDYEEKIFAPGREVSVVATKLGGLGLMICYDQVYPEMARKLAMSGAEIILHSSAWSNIPREMDWGAKEYRVFSNARAMENTVFMVSSNRIGVEGKFRFVGQSRVIAPWGEVLAERRHGEGCALAKVDLETLKKCRSIHPCLEKPSRRSPRIK